jgi:MOSC domain-containing protein YiiM
MKLGSFDGGGASSIARWEKNMWRGTIESINIADGAQESMRAIAEVRAIPGVGLEGDRYALQKGTFSKPEPSHELTLIEAEAIEALSRDCAIELAPGDARRNLVTRDVPLNHLAGKEFFIGEVKIRGIRLCEPCDHLQQLTERPGLIRGLLHRGGLRAQILSEGIIRVGEVVRE